jgi:hypothetical protein
VLKHFFYLISDGGPNMLHASYLMLFLTFASPITEAPTLLANINLALKTERKQISIAVISEKSILYNNDLL